MPRLRVEAGLSERLFVEVARFGDALADPGVDDSDAVGDQLAPVDPDLEVAVVPQRVDLLPRALNQEEAAQFCGLRPENDDVKPLYQPVLGEAFEVPPRLGEQVEGLFFAPLRRKTPSEPEPGFGHGHDPKLRGGRKEAMSMRARSRSSLMTDRIARFLHVAGVGILTMSALLTAPGPVASADPCPDVEAIFARGTSEPPGVGGVGQAFVDALRARVGNRSLNVYSVNYPASSDFTAGMQFAATVVEGIRDAANHLQATAAACPNTRIVLGGFSQGATVAGF